MRPKKGGGRGGYNHGPALAPRPAGFDAAVVALAAEMLKVPGVSHVGYGFGLGDGLKAVSASPAADGAPTQGRWQLYVYANDPAVKVPAEFAGFPVYRRTVPTASPAGTNRRGR
jgi:hypothetical protein